VRRERGFQQTLRRNTAVLEVMGYVGANLPGRAVVHHRVSRGSQQEVVCWRRQVHQHTICTD
jgi:hypothetical protein